MSAQIRKSSGSSFAGRAAGHGGNGTSVRSDIIIHPGAGAPSSGERTNWRCEDFSGRHRRWGADLFCTDVDFLEFDLDGEPVAVIEVKRGLNYEVRPTLSHRALARLADRARLPFFFVVYRDRPWTFKVFAGNALARRIVPEPVTMSEAGYIELLRRLRREAQP